MAAQLVPTFLKKETKPPIYGRYMTNHDFQSIGHISHCNGKPLCSQIVQWYTSFVWSAPQKLDSSSIMSSHFLFSLRG